MSNMDDGTVLGITAIAAIVVVIVSIVAGVSAVNIYTAKRIGDAIAAGGDPIESNCAFARYTEPACIIRATMPTEVKR